MALLRPTTVAAARPRWAIPLIVVAVVVVALAAVIGIRGLTGNPVRALAADGSTTLSGGFEPVDCPTGCPQGYLQAGARSVFVRFPDGCRPPAREQQVTVLARPAPDLGKASYRALACP